MKKLIFILFFTTSWSNVSLSDISLDTNLKGKTIFCYYSSPDKLAEMLGAEFINSKQVNLAISDKVATDFQIYKSTYQIKEFYYKPSLDGKKKIYTPVINIKFPNIKVRYDVDQIEIFSSKNLYENLSKVNGEYKDNELVSEVIRFIERDKKRPICSPQN